MALPSHNYLEKDFNANKSYLNQANPTNKYHAFRKARAFECVQILEVLKLIFSSISELTKQFFFFNLNYCDKILKNYELGNLRISDDLWKNCVRYQPIFAIDVVIYCKNLGILTGKRKNQPAKNKF